MVGLGSSHQSSSCKFSQKQRIQNPRGTRHRMDPMKKVVQGVDAADTVVCHQIISLQDTGQAFISPVAGVVGVDISPLS